MPKFNPAMLVPASSTPEFGQAVTRTTRDVALANITRMKEQWAAGDAAEGRRNYRVQGDRVAFTIRVGNQALVLARVEGEAGAGEVRELAVPRANFAEALDYMADRVRAGELDDQLAALDVRKAARTEKLRGTRAARRADKQPA